MNEEIKNCVSKLRSLIVDLENEGDKSFESYLKNIFNDINKLEENISYSYKIMNHLKAKEHFKNIKIIKYGDIKADVNNMKSLDRAICNILKLISCKTSDVYHLGRVLLGFLNFRLLLQDFQLGEMSMSIDANFFMTIDEMKKVNIECLTEKPTTTLWERFLEKINSF